MIKVNLLKDKASGALNLTEGEKGNANPNAVDVADILIKLALSSICVIGLLGYRKYTYDNAVRETNILNKQQADVEAKLRSYDGALREIEKFQEEKKKVDSQLETIKRLSRERLKNVKSLDALQSLIPQRTWLTNLKVTDNRVEINGLAIDDLVISEFMQGLNDSIYFANVVLVGTEAEKATSGVLRKYTIKCNLENL